MSIVLTPAWQGGSPNLDSYGGSESQERIVSLPEWEIRDELFFASIDFRIQDLELGRNSAPVVGFALSLRSGLDALLLDGESEVQFPGSTDRLWLTLAGGEVEIRANYAKGPAKCSFVDLYRSVITFMRDCLDEITKALPKLLTNDFLEALYRSYLVREKDREQFVRHSEVVADIYSQRTPS